MSRLKNSQSIEWKDSLEREKTIATGLTKAKIQHYIDRTEKEHRRIRCKQCTINRYTEWHG